MVMALSKNRDRRSSIISTRGRITIPVELRKDLNLKPGSALLVAETNGRLVFTPLREKTGRKVPRSRRPTTGN